MAGKEHFLQIYHQVCLWCFTIPTILSTFHATGLVPFNRNIITEGQMVPSKEGSSLGSLPLTLPPTIGTVLDGWHRYGPGAVGSSPIQEQELVTPRHEECRPETGKTDVRHMTPEQRMVHPPLASALITRILICLDYSILKSSPEYAPDALAVENVRLQIELQKAQTQEHKLTSQLDQSCSQMTLQGIYCDAMAKWLNNQEKKAQKHHSNHDRVSMGGQRLMTSDKWVQACIADEEEAAAEEAAAEAECLRKATLGTKKLWCEAEAAE
ncbi:hypothetical protein FRB94_001996 [Tulasnella sp. JGI-2019a]|nr:hypothetical protein FRB94_001996 [Tulasnella sp. JGI-2019a]